MHTLRTLSMMGASLMIAGAAWAGFAKVYTYPLPPGGSCFYDDMMDARLDEMSDFDGDGDSEVFTETGPHLSILAMSGSAFTPLAL